MEISSEFKERLFSTLCAASLFSLTFFLFGPLNLYFTNISEFSFLLSDVWYLFLSVALLCIALLTIFLLPLRFSIHKMVVSLLFVFAFLLWLQGNILVWNYGLLDGREIRWNEYKLFGLIDTSVWSIFLIIVFVIQGFIYKIIKKVSIGLILIQIISLGVVWYQAPEQPNWKKYAINGEQAYNFSVKKNVIILVLDTFQTDIFQELINENPEYKNIFKGFTYFRNAVGGYPTTYASIPLILTGQYYDNSVPIQEFIKNAYLSSSISLALKRDGFQIDLFPNVKQSIYINENMASNIVQATAITNKKNTIIKMYNITLFRYMPQCIKKSLFNITNSSITNLSEVNDYMLQDLDFARNVLSESKAVSDKNTFKFFHLRGLHPPFQLNEQLQYMNLGSNRDGYKIQAKATLEITRRFLTALKNIGVYDNSIIFIVGDHGLGSFGVNVEASGYSQDIMGFTNIIGSGIPLILVKPFASMEDMKISDAPVSLSDIPKTIVSELGLNEDYPGSSMFEITESDTRERRFMFYNWTEDYWEWDKEYLPAMREYIVRGFSWLNKSWRTTYRKFTLEGIQDIQPPIYQYGSEIQFGVEGNARQYQCWGWSEPEKGFTWTDGKKASLIIPVNQPQTDLTLKAVLTPFVYDRLDSQRIIIYINGQKLGGWTIRASGEYTIPIPKNLVDGSSMEISFELPNAASPLELQISDDSRTLGVALQKIKISQPTTYQYGSVIKFGINGNAIQYQGDGWSEPENGFTWTNGKIATLIIPISQPNSDLIFKTFLNPFVSNKQNRQRVNIIVNGDKIGEFTFNAGGEYTFTIPKNLVNYSFLKIVFELPDAVSPSELGISNDKRTLGIAMQSATLLEE